MTVETPEVRAPIDTGDGGLGIDRLRIRGNQIWVRQSLGVTGDQPDIVEVLLTILGLGLVHPRRMPSFYDER
jgi:hypothetical protein